MDAGVRSKHPRFQAPVLVLPEAQRVSHIWLLSCLIHSSQRGPLTLTQVLDRAELATTASPSPSILQVTSGDRSTLSFLSIAEIPPVGHKQTFPTGISLHPQSPFILRGVAQSCREALGSLLLSMYLLSSPGDVLTSKSQVSPREQTGGLHALVCFRGLYLYPQSPVYKIFASWWPLTSC